MHIENIDLSPIILFAHASIFQFFFYFFYNFMFVLLNELHWLLLVLQAGFIRYIELQTVAAHSCLYIP